MKKQKIELRLSDITLTGARNFYGYYKATAIINGTLVTHFYDYRPTKRKIREDLLIQYHKQSSIGINANY